MSRRILLASAGAVALTGAAFAADLPLVPPAPIFTWTGIYLGGQIGYAWGADGFTAVSPATGIAIASSSFSPQGVIGGAHAGYNLQVNQWVLGLEGDVDGSSFSKTIAPGVGPFFGETFTTRSNIQGSIRGRAGIALDRALIYATGGVAFAGIINAYTTPGEYDSESKTRVGWTVGGGLEYAVTNNWSVRAEYRYADFGHFTGVVVVPPPPAPTAPFIPDAAVHHHLTENRVQVGVSYKFDPF